jgi:hypothetical protein
MYMKTVATTLLISASLAGCGRRGPSKAEVDRMVDERLAERGVPLAAASASASAEPSPPPADPNPQVAESMAFLHRLDELMKGYEPELPQVVDNTDALRCVTTYAGQTDPRLKDLAAKTAADKKASLAAREQAEREFRDKVRPLNFRIDYDWKTRGIVSPPVYGCWVTGNWSGNAEWRDVGSEGSCVRMASYYAVSTEWKVKVPGGSLIYTYTRSTDPPSAPPELMRRIASANVTLPDRFACRVADAVSVGDRVVVRCGEAALHRTSTPPASASETESRYAPIIRLTRSIPLVNIGDVVSVPFANTKRDPDGLLLLWNPTAPKGRPVWTVDADGASLKVEEAAKCPTVDEIVSATDAGKD